jgi:hypothetical protein
MKIVHCHRCWASDLRVERDIFVGVDLLGHRRLSPQRDVDVRQGWQARHGQRLTLRHAVELVRRLPQQVNAVVDEEVDAGADFIKPFWP